MKQIKLTRCQWSPEEKNLLRELFPNTPLAEMAKQLDRPEASVTGQAATMGLERSAEYWKELKAAQAARARAFNLSRGRHWTAEETAFILANPTLSRNELAAHFNTAPGTIYSAVSTLRRQGLLPKALPKKKKARPTREAKRELVKPPARKQITTAVRKAPVVKVVEQKEPYDRDKGRIRVRVDARTEKFMTPEAAEKFMLSNIPTNE